MAIDLWFALAYPVVDGLELLKRVWVLRKQLREVSLAWGLVILPPRRLAHAGSVVGNHIKET